MKNKFVCIHGHFYQPPRENPWLNSVEKQDSAYPFHDWNHRITAECYARNSASRFLDHQGRIIGIVNNYARISFNFGPTLLEWIEKNSSDVYEAILQADRESMKRFSGHGSAIAQVYNHMIMPLANWRDKETQVKWGIRDFEKRFNRYPEGIWLGETAADTETLEVLADNGIKFTILSPYQAKRFRNLNYIPETSKEEELVLVEETKVKDVKTEKVKPVAKEAKKIWDGWHDAVGAKIDPRNAYLCKLPSGRTINLFFYDGPISQGIAFERLLDNGEAFAQRLLEQVANDENTAKMIHIATDGETYGHHHHFGEMALSYCLQVIEQSEKADLSIYGEFLEKHPPEYEVEIIENTSWSCYHGVERWRSNCGCNTGGRAGWNQEWRKPLRDAFDWLRDELAPLFDEHMKELVQDPWEARNEYIEVIYDRSHDNVDAYLQKLVKNTLTKEQQVKLLKLLEMQYHAMLMFTSCGWFFDEVTGLESMQDIMYAARAIQLAQEVSGEDFQPQFLQLLSEAQSNLPELKDAANAYEKYVKPAIVDLHRVGAHYAVSSIFSNYSKRSKIYSYWAQAQEFKLHEAGKYKLGIGQVLLQSEVTREEHSVTFAILYLGDHHIFGGVRQYSDNNDYEFMKSEMTGAFSKSNVHEIIILMDKHFGTHSYSFWHLFKDDQQKIVEQVLETTSISAEGMMRQLYQNNYPIMQAVKELNLPLPHPIRIPLEFIVNAKLRKLLEQQEVNINELNRVQDEINRLSVNLDTLTLNYIATQRFTRYVERLFENPEDLVLMKKVVDFLKILKELPLTLDLWRSENLIFLIRRIHFEAFSYKSERGNVEAQTWMHNFNTLYEELNMKM